MRDEPEQKDLQLRGDPSQAPADLSADPHESADGGGLDRVRDFGWSDWLSVAKRVQREIAADRLNVVAGGVAFFAFLSLFPLLTATISAWGLLADPTQVEPQLRNYGKALPPSALELLTNAAERFAASPNASLGGGVLVSVLLTVWSANRGMFGLMQGIAIAYDLDDRERGYFLAQGLSLLMTLGAVTVLVSALGLVIVMPIFFSLVGIEHAIERWFNWGRWPLLAMFVATGLGVIYRVAPPRKGPRWRWITPGSIFSTVLWLFASFLFSAYVENYGDFDRTYGSIAAVAVLLMWFYLSAFIVLVGAELNAEVERHAEPEPEPPGEIATVAVGDSSGSELEAEELDKAFARKKLERDLSDDD